MEADRFDHWTRSLTTARSRRGVIAALGAALGLLGGRAAAAGCPGLGVRFGCDNDGDCADCGGAVCQGNTCLRPPAGGARRTPSVPQVAATATSENAGGAPRG